MNDYRVEIRMKNDRILSLIENAGYKSVSEFCRLNEITNSIVGRIINFKLSPLKLNGEFLEAIEKVSIALGVSTDELFTEKQLYLEMESNKRVLKMKEAELVFLNDQEESTIEAIENKIDKTKFINAMMKKLTPMEQNVINCRFYHNMTLAEVAETQNVGVERIRQIQLKSLCKLRDRYNEYYYNKNVK
jgi:RNA polymerase sigma factor (sigma-70 family)